ncbi:MAG: hypothetical protein CM15mP16_06120 [Candidatus Pelagibacterales bacterium]|nr:MAG: hypothetical protein CM15mP16_06120 [Pelagibacterales bacterium]
MIKEPIKKIKLNLKIKKYFKILEGWEKKKFHNESSILDFKKNNTFLN